MQSTVRIAILTRSLMMGGAQNHIVKLCQELEKKNISISIFLLINDEPRDLIKEIPARFQIYISPYRRHDVRTVFWLVRSIRKRGIHLVHSFLWHADFYASLLKLLIPNIIVIASERGDRSSKDFYTRIYHLIDRLVIFNLANGFCANSEFGANLLYKLGCERRKVNVIHNGIDLNLIDSQKVFSLREKYHLPKEAMICGVVSRLVAYKGVDSFVKVLKLCKEDIRIIIIGDGPERESLSDLVKKLKLDNRVFLHGQYYPAIPFIKAFDVCVLPTPESEHCSNSILEYMACAKPVVAFSVGGNSELVLSGKTGFLVYPGRVEEIAKVLDKLSLERRLSEELGIAGRKQIENYFQMKDVAEKFFNLWQEFYRNGNNAKS